MQISVSAGTAYFPIHPALYELTFCGFLPEGGAERKGVRLVSDEWLDKYMPRWREESGFPLYALQEDRAVRLAPTPDVAGTLILEGYRFPLKDMAAMEDAPEINAAHHVHLVQWVLHRAFSVPDTEFFDPDRAARAEAEFTRYFGLRPDSDLRRITREDTPQHNEAFWV
jgi:hypothetical protein